jgi:hypothetical protein
MVKQDKKIKNTKVSKPATARDTVVASVPDFEVSSADLFGRLVTKRSINGVCELIDANGNAQPCADAADCNLLFDQAIASAQWF